MSMSMLMTSNVSQLKKMSADSLPVVYFDFSSSAIDFDSQIVGDDCWSSFTDTTWIENKSLNHMMSPDSSRRNFIPLRPRFSDRLESHDSMIWKKWFWRRFVAQFLDFFLPPSIRRRKNGQRYCYNSFSSLIYNCDVKSSRDGKMNQNWLSSKHQRIVAQITFCWWNFLRHFSFREKFLMWKYQRSQFFSSSSRSLHSTRSKWFTDD